MEMVKLESQKDYLSLKNSVDDSGFLTLDTKERVIATQLDLIIMSGLAFDLNRNRLGYGRGCQEWTNPPKTNNDIPESEYDRKLDLILSPNQNF
ncbi:8050_t:CDS:2 [Dentiscutata erythropus]|uniref:8050_t:CDS:1 n=1 Tax=Dentiscutata erythropus TaxID=1348616 RepID=A0A9N9CXM1_9GLOM|nr:8050_t:CDS:2 [Dentiscutata erythropus]